MKFLNDAKNEEDSPINTAFLDALNFDRNESLSED